MIGEMQAAFAKSCGPVSNSYQGWTRYSKVAYVSGTHGNRLVQNYCNAKAKAYGKFENAGRMPVGAILAKDSFQVTGAGKDAVGPLFVMEKISAGWNRLPMIGSTAWYCRQGPSWVSPKARIPRP